MRPRPCKAGFINGAQARKNAKMALPMTPQTSPAKPFDPNSTLGDRSTAAARSGVGNATGATPQFQQKLNEMAEAAYDKQKAAGPAPASTPASRAAALAEVSPARVAQSMREGQAADAQTAKMQARGAYLKARMDAAAAKKSAGAGPNRAKGGPVKAKAKAKAKMYAKGGSVSSASKRADGCATKGKTRGRIF